MWRMLVRTLWTLPTNAFGHLAGFVVSGGQRPRRVTGPCADAWLYPIRSGFGLDWVAAVTLGHVVLFRPGMFEGMLGRVVLAHELAHTRQHDLLGPFYVPLHILAQTTSAILSTLVPGTVPSRVHAYNPLEQTFICLAASVCGELAGGALMTAPERDRLLSSLGA